MSLAVVAALAAVVLWGVPATGVEAPEGAQESELLYVASQSGPAVTVIDTGSREVVETIRLTDLGFTPNAKPHHVAVEPDGSHWYVSLISDHRVLKFTRDNELVGQAEFETPGMLALDPTGDVLFVGRSMAAVNPPPRIGVIQRPSMEIEEFDVFFPRPHAMVVAPGGGAAYTASLAENRMALVQPESEEIALIAVPGTTHTFVQFAVSPDGRYLVTGGQVSGRILVWDLSTDPEDPEMVASVELGGEPWHPSYSPDGRFVYFPQRSRNAVAVIDTSSWEVAATITGDGLAEPHGSALSSDGAVLWVSGRNTEGAWQPPPGWTGWDGDLPPGTVVAIDTASREILTVLPVPPYAAGMGVATRR